MDDIWLVLPKMKKRFCTEMKNVLKKGIPKLNTFYLLKNLSLSRLALVNGQLILHFPNVPNPVIIGTLSVFTKNPNNAYIPQWYQLFRIQTQIQPLLESNTDARSKNFRLILHLPTNHFIAAMPGV